MPRKGIGWISPRRIAVLAVSLSLLAGAAAAQQVVADGPAVSETGGTLTLGPESQSLTPNERYHVEPTRTARPPLLDGVLNEEEWLSAAVIDEFIQQEPSEGGPGDRAHRRAADVRRTRALRRRRAYDSIPNDVIATEMRRDSRQLFDEDNFQLILDTFSDSRSGYMFVTSPLGAKLEQQIARRAKGGYRANSSSINSNVNLDWDGVWDVSAQRTDQGWVAEIAIPMVKLRFPETDRQVWGVNFMRNIRRKNEQAYWTPIPKGFDLMRVSLAGTMTGLGGVDRGLDLRITPYLLAGGRQDRVVTAWLDGSGFNDVGARREVRCRLGYEPRRHAEHRLRAGRGGRTAGQPDTVPALLSRKTGLLPRERRMFSLKSQGGFRPLADMFFTRRVGLVNGRPIPILAGTRLTGKVDRHNIAGDEHPDPSGRVTTRRELLRRPIQPRHLRAFEGRRDDHQQGGDRRRTLQPTFAVDTSLTPPPFFSVTGFVAKTESPHLSNDDMMGHLQLSWLSPGYRIYGEYTDIQDNFNPEVGFVPRIGIRRSKLHSQWNPRPGKWGIRQMDPMMNIESWTDQNNRLLSRNVHHMIGFHFEDGSNFTLVCQQEVRTARCAVPDQGRRNDSRGHVSLLEPSGTVLQRPVASSLRQRQLLASRVLRRHTDGLGEHRSTCAPPVASPRRGASAGATSTCRVAPSSPDLASVTFNLALSPEMTLRTLTQYNSTSDSISTSVRFNWIYSPGSDIYIAYDELRADDLLVVDPTLRHAGRVPWVQNRQLAIKMTYLLSR